MSLLTVFFMLMISFVGAGHIYSDPVKHLECILHMRTSTDCPVDGGWSQWGDWESCQGQCGQVGHHVRRRLCTNPTPHNGGYECRGKREEIKSCQLLGCVSEDYEKLIRGDPLRSAQYELIKAVHERFPALAMKCLENRCRYETVENVLHSGASDYWTSLHCVKHNVGCPVHGGWTPWNSWSHCSAICGHGKRYRQRTCTNPRPTAVDLDCEGPKFEQESCLGTACAEHIDGEWFVWSPWSTCSENCGPGIRKRKRKCQGQRHKREASLPSYGQDRLNRTLREVAKQMVQAVDAENRCSGPTWEIEKCANKECDWNGGWSDWEEWTPCSASCDLGFQSRSRSCSSPPMRGSGVQCAGETTVIRHCYMQPCFVKPHLLAMFNGASQLIYPATGQPKTLLHIYIRFLPLQPHAKLIYRHDQGCVKANCDGATLALEGGYLKWQALAQGCKAIAYSEDKLEINKWHEVLLTITCLKISMRIDDSTKPLEAYFNCVPRNPNFDHEMIVGEYFHGHIEHMNVNFRPIYFRQNPVQQYSTVGSVPTSSSNMHYGTSESEIEEGFRHFADNELIAASCPQSKDHWKVELAVKIEAINGLLLLLPTDDDDNYTEVVLELGRVKLREHSGNLHSEVTSHRKFVSGDWIYVVVSRGGVLRDGNFSDSPCDVGMSVNGDDRIALASTATKRDEDNTACTGQLFIGSAPLSHQAGNTQETEGFTRLSGFLGFLAIDGKSKDVEALPSAVKSGQVLSSHTISTADHYVETTMTLGQQINLSCYYGNSEPLAHSRNPTATWLFLDAVIDDMHNEAQPSENAVDYNMKDDGVVTHLVIPSYPSRESIEGFYLCWVEKEGEESNVLVAFGVTIVGQDVVLGTVLYVCGVLSILLTLTFQLVRLLVQYRRKLLLRRENEHNEIREIIQDAVNNDPEMKIQPQNPTPCTTLRVEAMVDQRQALTNDRRQVLLCESDTSVTQYEDDQSHEDGVHSKKWQKAHQHVPQGLPQGGDTKCDDLEYSSEDIHTSVVNYEHNPVAVAHDGRRDDVVQEEPFEQHYLFQSERQTQHDEDEKQSQEDTVDSVWTLTPTPSKTYTSDVSLQPSLPSIPLKRATTAGTCLLKVSNNEESESGTDDTVGQKLGSESTASISDMSLISSNGDTFVKVQQTVSRRTMDSVQTHPGHRPVPQVGRPEIERSHGEQTLEAQYETTSPRTFAIQRPQQVSQKQLRPSSPNHPMVDSRRNQQVCEGQNQATPLTYQRPTSMSKCNGEVYEGQQNQIPPNNNATFDNRCTKPVYESSNKVLPIRKEKLENSTSKQVHLAQRNKLQPPLNTTTVPDSYQHRDVYQREPVVARTKEKFKGRHGGEELENCSQSTPLFSRQSSHSEGELHDHQKPTNNNPKFKSRFTHQQPMQHTPRCWVYQQCRRSPQAFCSRRPEAHPLAEFQRLAQVDDDRNAEIFGTYRMANPYFNTDGHSRRKSEDLLDLQPAAQDDSQDDFYDDQY